MTIPKLKRRLGALLYHTVAKHLPPSYSSLSLARRLYAGFAEDGCWPIVENG